MALSRKFWSAKNSSPGDQNLRRNGPPRNEFFENFGPCVEIWSAPFWFKVHYSSTVKHHAMLLRSKVATQVLSNFVHLLNCCQRMAIKVCWPCIHGSVIPEAAEKHTLEVWKITNLMIMLKRRSSWLRRHNMST